MTEADEAEPKTRAEERRKLRYGWKKARRQLKRGGMSRRQIRKHTHG